MEISGYEIYEWAWKILEQKENQMQFTIYENPEYGWYICVNDGTHKNYLRKDLKIHDGTDEFKNLFFTTYGSASGYYPSRGIAEIYLQTYLNRRRNKMNDNIEITVKVNDVETPLHEISEQTLLTVRKNSKPKEIPVARIASTPHDNRRRLILRVPKNIDVFAKSKFIVIDLKNGSIQNNYEYGETREPKDYYKNVVTIE